MCDGSACLHDGLSRRHEVGGSARGRKCGLAVSGGRNPVQILNRGKKDEKRIVLGKGVCV